MPQSICNKDIDENSPEESQRIIGAYVLKLFFNPLYAELNPICHFLALLGAHPILHASRIRVN
jgi:hypothetical protein